MSIIQDLYNIYDKELTRYRTRKSSGSRLLIEMQHNLGFLRESLREKLPHAAIVKGLEDKQFRTACKQGFNLDGLQKKKLQADTYAEIREFERYRGWQTGKLIENVYERIATLKKLAAGSADINLHPRLLTLFKFLMVVLAHVEGRKLNVPRKSDTK